MDVKMSKMNMFEYTYGLFVPTISTFNPTVSGIINLKAKKRYA